MDTYTEAELDAMAERWALDDLDLVRCLKASVYDAQGILPGAVIVVVFKRAVNYLKRWRRL